MHQSFQTPTPPPTSGIPEVNRGQSLGFHPFQFPSDQGRHLLSQPWSTYRRIYRAMWTPYIEISNSHDFYVKLT